MSRYNAKKVDGTHVSYGYDDACGFFYQEFDKDDEENCLLDIDSLFTGLTGGGLARELEKIDDIPMTHITLARAGLIF